MRESSSNLFKQNSQKPKDIRGGEKKVMKKSLSTILSLAMAFSMFSSVAFGEEAAKSSADFSDLKDLDAATKAKFDEMISAGVFDGVSEGTFGLKDKMNRAQFAKVAALIFKLKVDTSLKTSSFTDVQADDPANGYALPYIEAVKAAGITDGYAPGEYNPAGEVTKEQLATFLIRGLGKDAEAQATPGVSDKTVSDWAKGYVALALQLKLLSSGTDGTFGGTSAATRDLLVLGSYEAKQQYKPVFSGKYAISSLKATDANVLSLQLNGALSEDAAKNLKVEVKKDGNVVTSGYTTTWSDDKTTATLTFESKFQDNKFDVTISGLDNIDDAAKTASVTTTPEKITKIDFLTASDTIPLTRDKNDNLIQKVRIDFKATNQYGAKTSLNASNFDIRVNGGTFSNVAGEQAILLSEEEGTERNDRISISVMHQDSGVQVNKIFTVGDESLVSKVEIGDLLNAAGVKIDNIEANSTNNYLDIKAYDQYGFRVEDKSVLNDDVSVNFSDNDLEEGPGTGDRPNDPFVDDVVGDTAADMQIRSTNNEEKDITITVYARGGNSATKTVHVNASKIPATVEFGSYNYTLAEGDELTGDEDVDKKFYIPLIARDSKGELLDADDIVDAYSNGDKDSKFDIRSTSGLTLGKSGSKNAEIATTGAYKGYLVVSSVDRKGSQSITVSLEDHREVSATLNISVSDARQADSIKFSTTPKKYIVGGTDTELKYKIYDQNGTEMKYSTDPDNDYKVKLSYSGTPTSTVQNGEDVYLASKEKSDANNRKFKLSTVTGTTYAEFPLFTTDAVKDPTLDPWDNFFDKSFKFYSTPNSPTGTWTLKATLIKIPKTGSNAGKEIELDTLSTTIERIDPSKSENKLTYEAYLDKGVNNTILAADDYFDVNNKGVANGNVSGATYLYNNYKKLTKEVKLRAKKTNGEEVAVPSGLYSSNTANSIISVTSNNPLVANVPNGAQNFVAGLEAGTAKISVLYRNAKGDQESKTIDVTTKNEGPAVASIALRKTDKTVDRNSIDGKYLWSKELAEKITVKDQFGDEVVSEFTPGATNEELNAADQFLIKANGTGQNTNDVLNLNFYISDITGGTTNDVSIDPSTGQISFNSASNVSGFTINVIAPSGVTAAFGVTVTGAAN
ncbi:S-layer homology domain-containing protein [Paenibacillus sp. TAB 01]|uniref:S-layer homology domain-containing protein n=1 Tax=Paenibacillus sp. TAB 01 TaxID=3368988 RepID=UPI00375046D6